jgi:hypothetical protein
VTTTKLCATGSRLGTGARSTSSASATVHIPLRVIPAQSGRGGRRDAEAQWAIADAISVHELRGGRPRDEVVRGARQAGDAANQEGGTDDAASSPRNRPLASQACDQRAGGGEPARDGRALDPTGHRLGAGDEL